jgi:hypothetical protein
VVGAIRQHPHFTAWGDSLCGGASVNWKSRLSAAGSRRLLCKLPGARGLGLELDSGVFHPTRNKQVRAASGGLLVVFIAPTWGHTLDAVRLGSAADGASSDSNCGLPAAQLCPMSTAMCDTDLRETIEPESLVESQERFEWSVLRIYDLNAPGQNHGAVLGICGYRPTRANLPACPLP